MAFLCFLGHSVTAEDCYTISDNTWSCGSPTSSDDLIIGHKVIIPGNFSTTATITIENGGLLEIVGDFNGSDCNVIIKNEGSFQVNGQVYMGNQCTVNVEGELNVSNALTVEPGAMVNIWGVGSVDGNVVLWTNSSFNLKRNSAFFVGDSFSNQSDATEIDGDLTIMQGLSNAGMITGVGIMSFTSCTSTGLINNLSPMEYCSLSPLNLLESHCSSTDTEAPKFSSIPNDIITYSNANNCEVAATWNAPEVTDNCSLDELEASHISGDLFQVGTTVITCNATDKAGNESTAIFNVTVKDTISPKIIDMPVFISVDAAPGDCGAIVSWDEPTATDNCSVSLVSDHNPGELFPVGSFIITYIATDPSGNKTSKQLQIKVNNPHAPVISACPSDTIIYLDKTSCMINVSWTEPEVEGCGVEISQTHNPGDLFSVGIHFIKYSASDNSGNVATCEFAIQVLDTLAPEFIGCPKKYTIKSTDTLAGKSIITWVAPEVIDNCTVAGLDSNFQPGDEFEMGLTEVIYTASDNNGNKSSCRFEVNAYINNPPVIEQQIFSTDAGESVRICLTVQDPDGDQVFLKSVVYYPNNGSIEEVDSMNLCFNYSSAIEFDGTDSLMVYVVDDGNLPLSSSAKIYINVSGDRTIEVASAITSNEDGINDKWIITNINFYPENSVHVYDPYGGIVFQTTGYDNQDVVWNGKNMKGKYVPGGTYFFAIIPGNDLEKITGAIEVIR